MKEFDYKEYLTEIGLKKNDIVDVVSDLLSFMIYCREKKMKFDANHLIDAMKEIVGEEGTILIRTFTWAFCRGESFDILNTPSEVGSLGNVAMKRNDFRRTKHPIYSWCVWGKDTEYLCKLDNISSFGENTPWDYLCKNDSKQLIIGNTQSDGLTVIHHFEQLLNVPYRADKIFEGEYIDEKKNHSIRRYTMFVKPLNIEIGRRGDFRDNEWFKGLGKNGVYKTSCFDNSISGMFYYYKGLEKYLMDEISHNYASDIWVFYDKEGYNTNKINWEMARYYSNK